MQGTLLMLVALGGLGCHNRGCDVAYAPPTYSSCFGVGMGCYADCYPGPVMPACYAGCFGGGYTGCYGGGWAGCYGGCYGGGCYGGWMGSCYTGCYGGWGCYGGCYGGKHHRNRCGSCGGRRGHHRKCCTAYEYACMPIMSGCYSTAYAPPIFGSALGMNYTPVVSEQSPGVIQYSNVPTKSYGGTTVPSTEVAPAPVPSEVTTPVEPAPAPATTTTPPTTTVPETTTAPETTTTPETPATPRIPATPKPPVPAAEGATPPPPPAPAGTGGRTTPPQT